MATSDGHIEAVTETLLSRQRELRQKQLELREEELKISNALAALKGLSPRRFGPKARPRPSTLRRTPTH